MASPHPRFDGISRAAVALIAAASVAILSGVVAGVVRPWSSPEQPPQAAAERPVLGPAAIHLPDEPEVLVLGDSWTYGMAATPRESGYAHILDDLIGGETIVDGYPGSGYVREGRPTFGERIAALDPRADYDLILVQGSINDRRSPAEGYREAVTAAWDALAALYPETPVVVLGPAPQVLPVEAPTARMDRDLASLAADRGWWYISPVQDGWITDDNYLSVIDTSDVGRNHPSVEGHAYLAQRVAEALDGIVDPATSVQASDEDPAR